MIDGAALSFLVPKKKEKSISAALLGSIWLTSNACLSTTVH